MRLESSLKDLESKSSKKTGSSEDQNKNKNNNDCSNGKRKRGCDKNKNGDDKEYYCLLHGKNGLHNSDQCRTLKQDAEKRKKEREHSGGKSQRVSKQEIHTIVQFAKQAMELAKNQPNNAGELNNFEQLSVSSNSLST